MGRAVTSRRMLDRVPCWAKASALAAALWAMHIPAHAQRQSSDASALAAAEHAQQLGLRISSQLRGWRNGFLRLVEQAPHTILDPNLGVTSERIAAFGFLPDSSLSGAPTWVHEGDSVTKIRFSTQVGSHMHLMAWRLAASKAGAVLSTAGGAGVSGYPVALTLEFTIDRAKIMSVAVASSSLRLQAPAGPAPGSGPAPAPMLGPTISAGTQSAYSLQVLTASAHVWQTLTSSSPHFTVAHNCPASMTSATPACSVTVAAASTAPSKAVGRITGTFANGTTFSYSVRTP